MSYGNSCVTWMLFLCQLLFQAADVLSVLPDGDDVHILVGDKIDDLVQFGRKRAVGDAQFGVFHKHATHLREGCQKFGTFPDVGQCLFSPCVVRSSWRCRRGLCASRRVRYRSS